MVSVSAVRSASERRKFINFPYVLYQESRYWVPPLRLEQLRLLTPSRNAYFEHGTIQPFLATDPSGEVVGRIAAITNGMHLRTYQDGAGFFGFFECVEDRAVAEALVDAVDAWLRRRGLTVLRGPTNPSINETSGLLVRGFDRRPAIMMPYNPPYYVDLLRRLGFKTAVSMRAYYGAWKHLNVDRLRRGAAIVRQRTTGLRVRKLDMNRFNEEIKIIHQLYNASFAGTWGHVPMTEAEFMQASSDMRQIADPDLIFILERSGKPIGFSLSLPNVNPILRHVPNGRLLPFGLITLLVRRRFAEISEFRTILLAVLPAFRNRGLDALLVLKTIDEGSRKGYAAAEMSWVMEDNQSLINALETLGCVRDKDYAILERPINLERVPR